MNIQIHTQEHQDLMVMFERIFKGHRLERETKDMWPKGAIYQNGETNELFKAFRQGVAYGIVVGRGNDLRPTHRMALPHGLDRQGSRRAAWA